MSIASSKTSCGSINLCISAFTGVLSTQSSRHKTCFENESFRSVQPSIHPKLLAFCDKVPNPFRSRHWLQQKILVEFCTRSCFGKSRLIGNCIPGLKLATCKNSETPSLIHGIKICIRPDRILKLSYSPDLKQRVLRTKHSCMSFYELHAHEGCATKFCEVVHTEDNNTSEQHLIFIELLCRYAKNRELPIIETSSSSFHVRHIGISDTSPLQISVTTLPSKGTTQNTLGSIPWSPWTKLQKVLKPSEHWSSNWSKPMRSQSLRPSISQRNLPEDSVPSILSVVNHTCAEVEQVLILILFFSNGQYSEYHPARGSFIKSVVIIQLVV